MLASAEMFAGSTWTSCAAMDDARDGHDALVLTDGRVLVVGGAGSGALQTTMLFQPGSDTWSPGGDIAIPRANFAAAVLPDGRAIILGGGPGLFSGAALSSSELFSPAALTWGPGPALNVARNYTTATLLANGQLLVAGGQDDGNMVPLASCELLVISPTILGPTTATMVIGQPFLYTISASNIPTTFSADDLPAGLTLDSATGIISGTPSQAGDHVVTLHATNAAGTATSTLTMLGVQPQAPDEAADGSGSDGGCGSGAAVSLIALAALGMLGLGGPRQPLSGRPGRPRRGARVGAGGVLLVALLSHPAEAAAAEVAATAPGDPVPAVQAPPGLGQDVPASVADLRLSYVGTVGHIRREFASSGNTSTDRFRESGVSLVYARSLPGGWSHWTIAVGAMAARATIDNTNGSQGDASTLLGVVEVGPTWNLRADRDARLDLDLHLNAGAGRTTYTNAYVASVAGIHSDTRIDADGPVGQLGLGCALAWTWASGWGSRLETGVVQRYVRLTGGASTAWSNGTSTAGDYRSSDAMGGLYLGYGLGYRF